MLGESRNGRDSKQAKDLSGSGWAFRTLQYQRETTRHSRYRHSNHTRRSASVPEKSREPRELQAENGGRVVLPRPAHTRYLHILSHRFLGKVICPLWFAFQPWTFSSARKSATARPAVPLSDRLLPSFSKPRTL